MKGLFFTLISILYDCVYIAIYAGIYGALAYVVYHVIILPRWDIPNLKMSDIWALFVVGFLFVRAIYWLNRDGIPMKKDAD